MAQPIKTNKSKLKLTVSRIRDQTCEVKGLIFYRCKFRKCDWTAVSVQKIAVVVARIYPPVTGQHQTLNIGRSAHFSLQWLLRGWRKPHLLRSFRWSKVPVDFFEFVRLGYPFFEFAACSKPPSRENHCKASYPRTPQRDQGAGWTQIMRSGSRFNCLVFFLFLRKLCLSCLLRKCTKKNVAANSIAVDLTIPRIKPNLMFHGRAR